MLDGNDDQNQGRKRRPTTFDANLKPGLRTNNSESASGVVEPEETPPAIAPQPELPA